MEGRLLCGSKWRAAIAAFDALPEDTRRALTFTPKKPGEWVEQARLFQDLWRTALPSRQYHAAMMKIIRHYEKCVRMRKGAAEA